MVLGRKLALHVLTAVVLAAALTAIGFTPTRAVCARLAGDDPIPKDAALVFVGSVADTAAHGQNALIHVEEIWRGGALPNWLPLIGTDDQGVLWEDQTVFHTGDRYLVVADRDGSVVRPRGCGYTTPYSANLAALRPAHPSSPVAIPRPIVWQPGAVPWLWLGTLAGGVLIVGAFSWGRRFSSASVAGPAGE